MGDYSNTALADIDVEALAERGRRIYAQKYQAEFEKKYRDKFAEIDLDTEKAYVGDTEHAAWAVAHKDAPNGFFYTVRIGYDVVHRL